MAFEIWPRYSMCNRFKVLFMILFLYYSTFTHKKLNLICEQEPFANKNLSKFQRANEKNYKTYANF